MPLLDHATLVVDSGNYLLAPVGTALPDQLLAPPDPWVSVGHTSLQEVMAITSEGGEASLVQAIDNRGLRTKYSARTDTLGFTLQQFDADSLRLFFGANAATLPTGMVGVPTHGEPTIAAFLAVFVDEESHFAFYAPRAEVYRRNSMSLSTEELGGLPLAVKPLVHGRNDWAYAVTPLAAPISEGGISLLSEMETGLVGPPGPEGPPGPPGPPGPAAAYEAVIKISDMLTEPDFYVAHRGSGAEFPEHTLAAYEAVVAAGCRYIEVSVNVTADGIPVCIHDQTLDRTTTATGPVLDRSFADVRNNIRTEDATLLGAGWEPQRLPTLREVLDRFLGRVIIFLEPKSNASYVPVQQMLTTFYPNFQQSVVWKNHISSSAFTWAKANGMTTWAYMDPDTTDLDLDEMDPLVDIWGLPMAMTDSRMAEIVARGKPCIAWEVHRRVDVARLTALGVQGKMCAQWLYLTRNGEFATSDAFASQVKAPGDMGLEPYNHLLALQYGASGEAYFADPNARTALLGRISTPTPPASYTLSFDMKWNALPGSTAHSGFAFCRPDDSPYRFSSTLNTVGGYHIVMRASGNMQLYAHTAGVAAGTLLAQSHPGTIPPEVVPVAGQWMSFEISVTPTTVTVTRTDTSTPIVISTADTTYRGGYIHLSTGSVTAASQTPYWRSVTRS